MPNRHCIALHGRRKRKPNYIYIHRPQLRTHTELYQSAPSFPSQPDNLDNTKGPICR